MSVEHYKLNNVLDWQALNKWHKNHDTLCGIGFIRIKYQVLNYIQDDGIWVVELSKKIGVRREHVSSTGGQVSMAPSLNVNIAPSEGHSFVLPV